MQGLILTYDIGTTGNKCSISDSSGRNLYSYTFPYGTLYPKPGWSEQSPDDYWNSVIKGTEVLFEMSGIKGKDIAVVGLCGHCNGCIPLSYLGKPLFNDIIHSDSRSEAQCDMIRELMGEREYYELTGNRLDPHWTLPKILWLKNNYPDIYEKTAYFLGGKDYIAYKLTGIAGVTDIMSASLTGIMDIYKKSWARDLAKSLKVDTNKLPQIKNSFEIAGLITSEAAFLTGLMAGTPVVVGGGDGACATKGAGVIEKNQAYNYIGSSSWISVLSDKPILDREERTFNYYDLDGESCLATGAVQCASISYDWVLKSVFSKEIEECGRSGKNMFDLADSMAEKVPIGSNGVFFIPYLMGERTPFWDKDTKGGFIGVSLYNGREDMIRASYEGISYALKNVIEVLKDNGLCPDSLTLIGGGAMSRVWNDILCNVTGMKLRIHKNPREATTLGASMAAGVGVGIYKDFKSAASKIQFDRLIEPEEQKSQEYEKHYEIYKMIYPALKPLFKEMSKL